MKGNVKCNEKNLLTVAELTEKPPQTNSTKDVPNHGMADNRLVMTVAKS